MSNLKYSVYDPTFGHADIVLADNGNNTHIFQILPKPFNYYHISSSGTFNVLSGSGIFGSILFNKGRPTSIISVFDGLDVSSSKICRIEHETPGSLTVQYQLHYNVKVTNGLTIQTSDSDDMTVTFTVC